MDYSKQGGGTRIHDQLKARTLATGMGQTVTSNRSTGSDRANEVARGIKPGQICAEPGLCELRDRRVAQDELHAKMTRLDPVNNGAQPVENKWPLESGSCTHDDCDTMAPHGKSDQGERTRVATTGRASGMMMQAPLRRAGK